MKIPAQNNKFNNLIFFTDFIIQIWLSINVVLVGNSLYKG